MKIYMGRERGGSEANKEDRDMEKHGEIVDGN